MLLKKNIPIFDWLPKYSKEWLRPDILAGLTTSAVVIPKSMAYAAIAGLPVEIGLYTALVPMLVYAILGTSRQLSVSTTTVIAILTASEIARVVPDAGSAQMIVAASTLAFLVGIFLLAAALLRLGFIANFISAPVLTGFKSGVGLLVIADQIPKLIGVHIDKGNFFENLLSTAHHLGGTHAVTLILGVITLVLVIGLEKRFPEFPAPLVAVVLGVTASIVLGLKGFGVELVGVVPSGLPSFSLPNISLIKQLAPGALGIALMSFTESIAAGRAFIRHGDPHPDADQELCALGMANVFGGFMQSIPASGGISQTAVNTEAGARSQIAELVTAGLVIITMLFLTPLVGMMPLVTLAAVVIAVSLSLIKPLEFRAIRRVHKPEFRWAIVAFLGVLFFGSLNGILVAVLISMCSLIYQANHPPVYALGRKKGTDAFRLLEVHPDDETFPGLLIVRTEGWLTFASIPRTREKFYNLIKQYSPSVVVLDLRAVPDIEYTALMALAEHEEKLHEHGITMWFTSLNPRAFETVKRSILWERLKDNRMFLSVEQAVEHYLKTTNIECRSEKRNNEQ